MTYTEEYFVLSVMVDKLLRHYILKKYPNFPFKKKKINGNKILISKISNVSLMPYEHTESVKSLTHHLLQILNNKVEDKNITISIESYVGYTHINTEANYIETNLYELDDILNFWQC